MKFLRIAIDSKYCRAEHRVLSSKGNGFHLCCIFSNMITLACRLHLYLSFGVAATEIKDPSPPLCFYLSLRSTKYVAKELDPHVECDLDYV